MNASDLMILIVAVQQDLHTFSLKHGCTEEKANAIIADLTVTRFWHANGIDFVAMTCPNEDPGPEIAYWMGEDGELRAVEIIDESEKDMETIRDQYIYANAN